MPAWLYSAWSPRDVRGGFPDLAAPRRPGPGDQCPHSQGWPSIRGTSRAPFSSVTCRIWARLGACQAPLVPRNEAFASQVTSYSSFRECFPGPCSTNLERYHWAGSPFPRVSHPALGELLRGPCRPDSREPARVEANRRTSGAGGPAVRGRSREEPHHTYHEDRREIANADSHDTLPHPGRVTTPGQPGSKTRSFCEKYRCLGLEARTCRSLSGPVGLAPTPLAALSTPGAFSMRYLKDKSRSRAAHLLHADSNS